MSRNIILLVWIVIIIGIVLFINRPVENEVRYSEQYVHYVDNATGYNTTDLGYTNEMNAIAEGNYSYAIGEDVSISETDDELIELHRQTKREYESRKSVLESVIGFFRALFRW